MPDDGRTVPVTLELDPDTAAALQDPATRARVERLIRHTIHSADARLGSPNALVDRFKAFAARHTLGLDVKTLISEGRR